ncbi:MAG: YggS family pyridoxal phosphate-dependent enzyme [Planctomycetota bacterium]
MYPLIPLSELPGGPDGVRSRLAACERDLAAAAERSGRSASDVRILTVSKYVGADVLGLLYELGVRDFGENRVQVLETKTETFADFSDARLHFIGHVQRNKLRKVLTTCEALHSLDSSRLLSEMVKRVGLGDPAPKELYVEVNVSGEEQKSGVAPGELAQLLEDVQSSPLAPSLRGLMTMAPRSAEKEATRPVFRGLRELRDEQVAKGLLPEGAGLSMGMSQDFDVAIEEGATIVRIGSLLFRDPA